MRKLWIGILLLALAFGPAPALAAGEIEGVRFPETLAVNDVELELSCMGLMRYMVVLKGYVAALYREKDAAAGDVLADVPKRLEINYFWDIEGEAIGTAGDELVVKNLSNERLERLRPQLDQILSLYEDVKPGDRYALTYIPGRGTELALNGVVKGVIEGADFANAYFSIWLGDDPMDRSLKKQLLSCS